MRVFLDTNIFILGVVDPDSFEGQILAWLGYFSGRGSDVEVVICLELLQQIQRVGRRGGGKDFSGPLINRIWKTLKLEFVALNEEEALKIIEEGIIPREDVEIFLGAKEGQVDFFISANRSLVQAAAAEQKLFESLSAEEFVKRFVSNA